MEVDDRSPTQRRLGLGIGAMLADRRLLLSILVVIGIAISQCAATQFAKASQNDFKQAVDSPLFMTWSSTILNIVLVAPALLQDQRRSAELQEAASRPRTSLWGKLVHRGPEIELSDSGFLARALLLYSLWLCANYTYQYALKLAPAALVAALFGTAPAYVAVASIFLLARPLPCVGWLAVLCSILGSILVVQPWQLKDQGGEAAEASLGLLLAFVAALAAAAYKVLFKWIFGDPQPVAVGVILAWIGAYAVTIGTMLLVVVLQLGLESVSWSHLPWQSLIPGSAAALAFNFLVAWGLAISYPLFVSLGTVLNVPLNALADLSFRGLLPNGMQLLGMLCIIVGFILLVYSDMSLRHGGMRTLSGQAGRHMPISQQQQERSEGAQIQSSASS